MSIASAVYAEYAESIRTKWSEKLEAAYNAKDWDAVFRIMEEIRSFHFSE
jgi:hypothetical protein